ncbi:hypothetical protein [Streptomyces sp. Root66D1]|nr:hypothetical protein [Streptomyces sp. Root66D1]
MEEAMNGGRTIGFSLLLVFVLDRPFAGELSVSPAPYREGALATYWEP